MVPKSGILTSWYDKYPMIFLGFQQHPNGGWPWDFWLPSNSAAPWFHQDIPTFGRHLFGWVGHDIPENQVGYGILVWRRFARWNFSEPQDFGVNKIFETIIYFRGSSHKRKLVESRWECWKRFGISLVGNSWKGKHLQTWLYISYIKSKKHHGSPVDGFRSPSSPKR